MKISESWLKEKSACSDGMAWFLSQKKTEDIDVLKALIKADELDWANWLICRVMDKPNCVRYAIFAALEVISIYEKKYPDDKRPRKAIEAAQAWLDNPFDKTKNAAYYAATAYSAADDAYSSAAADAAAYSAAAADAAAYSAAAAAAAAAADAADAAARKKLQIKILEYGLTLLEDKAK
jgi:hypothetical protein